MNTIAFVLLYLVLSLLFSLLFCYMAAWSAMDDSICPIAGGVVGEEIEWVPLPDDAIKSNVDALWAERAYNIHSKQQGQKDAWISKWWVAKKRPPNFLKLALQRGRPIKEITASWRANK